MRHASCPSLVPDASTSRVFITTPLLDREVGKDIRNVVATETLAPLGVRLVEGSGNELRFTANDTISASWEARPLPRASRARSIPAKTHCVESLSRVSARVHARSSERSLCIESLIRVQAGNIRDEARRAGLLCKMPARSLCAEAMRAFSSYDKSKIMTTGSYGDYVWL
jgi:hypothetical protein